MLDFRSQRRVAPRRPYASQYLWMLVGLAVVLMLVLRARPAGDGPAGLPLGGELWADAGGQPQVAAGARPEGLFPGIDPATVETIRDNTVFRSAESDAWFGWLKLLDQMTPQELATLPAAPVGYLQLERQPSAYRGHTVRMSGIIRRAKEVATPDNPQGIERYYQLWLQPVRGEPQLVVIYALELPADFPLGDGLDAPASVTGIFYKHWAYASQSGILTAPLLLAKTIDWKPPPPAPPPPAPLNEQLLLAVAAALSIALAIVGWIVIRNRGSRRRPVADAQVTIAVPDDDQA